jgi:hypothetical protein
VLIYLFFGTGFVWGALAVWFVQPSWVGIGISSLLVVWAYTFTLRLPTKEHLPIFLFMHQIIMSKCFARSK